MGGWRETRQIPDCMHMKVGMYTYKQTFFASAQTRGQTFKGIHASALLRVHAHGNLHNVAELF